MSPDYADLKALHVTCVVASVSLFALRYAWRVAAPETLAARWVRVVPHVVDTLLFASAVWLAWQLGRGSLPWVGAKLVALVVYIVLGSIALKRGSTAAGRAAAFVAALGTLVYIVSVALTKSPWGFIPRP